MKILITRPEPDGSRLARILKKMGHETRLAPMMHIETFPARQVDIKDAQALLVTSANGARALGPALKERNIKVFAVGDATAAAIRHEGFTEIAAAGGDVNSLAAKVIADCQPEGGRLIHVAGTEVAGDLSGMLTDKGFQCERVVLYEALPVTSLEAKIVKEIKNGSISAILFYSPRTAAIFVGLVTAAGLAPHMKKITAYCLSEAVAAKLESLSFAGIHIATTPDQENLLALLTAVSQARKEDNPEMPRERNMSDKNSGKSEEAGKSAVPTAGTDRNTTKDTKSESKESASPNPATNTERAEPKSRVGLVLMLLVVVFCLGLAAWPLLYPKVEPYLPTQTAEIISGQFGKSSATDMSDQTAAIEAVRDNLKSDYAALSARIAKLEAEIPATNAASGADNGQLADLSGSLKQELSELSSELSEQQNKLSAALEELSQQKESLGKLENADPVVAEASPEIQNQIVDLKTALLDIKTQITNLDSSIESDREEVKSQAQQLSSLASALKAEIASKSEDDAENQRTLMLLAIGQLQRETRGSDPFENGLNQVEAVANDKFKGLVENLEPIAPVGAPTLAGLQKEFTSIASDISQSARLPSEETWYGEALHRIASAVKFRRVDDVEGNDVDAVVARTEQDLADSDLDQAVAEIEKLSGAAAEVAAPWLEKAKTRLTVEQSISGLLEAATSTAISQPTSN
jgi:uroporphyrinogen-III synthase